MRVRFRFQEEGMRLERDAMAWHKNPLHHAEEFGLNPVGSWEPLKDLQQTRDLI